MRKLKLKGIICVTSLCLILSGCAKEEIVKKEESLPVEQTTESIQYEESTHYEEPTIETEPEELNPSIETEPTIVEPTIEESNNITNETEAVEDFKFFKEAKEEIKEYIESEEFENLKTKGKYYVTTGIDFIFFDEPINGIYFDQMTTELKKDIIRDVAALDQAIMAYYPNYKESFSSKYQIASEFVSEQYLSIMGSIKEYLGEENYNAVGEIKDQVKEDLSTKTEEAVENIKELYKTWKNK